MKMLKSPLMEAVGMLYSMLHMFLTMLAVGVLDGSVSWSVSQPNALVQPGMLQKLPDGLLWKLAKM